MDWIWYVNLLLTSVSELVSVFVFGNFRTVLFMILMFCAGRDMCWAYTSALFGFASVVLDLKLDSR